MGNEMPQQGVGSDSGSDNNTTNIRPLRRSVIRKKITLIDNVANFNSPKYFKPYEKIRFFRETLAKNFLFQCLDNKEREQFINALQEDTVERGVDIIKQGDIGDYFYIIEQGQIACFIDGKKRTTLCNGECFGELSLLYGQPRTATCRAATKVILWKIDFETFRSIIALGEKKKKNEILYILKKVSFLTLLDDDHLHRIIDALVPISCARGTQIIKKGEFGNNFYIITEGSAKIHDIGVGHSNFLDKIISAGDYFGELALQNGEARKANVTALTDCSMMYLSRVNFQKTIGNYYDILKIATRREILLTAPVFASSALRPCEINELACLFEEAKIVKGTQIAKIGDSVCNPGFCIIEEGSVRIVKRTGTIIDLIKGDHFGGDTIKLPNNYTSERTIEILKPTKLAVLNKSSIESVIFSTERLGQPQTFEKPLAKINLDDLNQYRLLGGDDNARVYLATHVKTSTPYALKKISKRKIINENKLDNIICERNIMASLIHFPFVANIVTTFQDTKNVYFLFDFIHGGELFNIIHSKKKIIKGSSEAVFYAACVIFSLIYLSDRSICYRNLMPENVLIDQNGYCVLIDFTEAKIVPEKTYTVCGAPEYMAPEMILCKGYNLVSDFWSFGIFLYELLASKTPFYSNNIDKVTLFKRIVKVKYEFPDNAAFTDDSKDLIKQLLVKKPHKRLGSLLRGARGVAKHAFFKNVDWKKLHKREIKAPWVPKIKGEMDPSNFDVYPETETETENETDDLLTNEEQLLFNLFSSNNF